ncbi:MAG TPA: GYDIA family GHMP kinase [Prolixibacteraceae bacterium]|jgi:mevalonate kinase
MPESILTYHANGKLLLCGEYFVLHGAKALALPLKLGQKLRVYHEDASKTILWKAFYKDEVWFWCELNPDDFSVIDSSDRQKAATLSKIFQVIQTMKPRNLPIVGTRLETSLDAHPDWGFGSSSTLISLLSQWLRIDPFRLNQEIFNGSGFDIACATAGGPILYIQNQIAQRVDLDYPFAEQLLLVYSGKKKNTLPEVRSFLNQKKTTPYLIQEVSHLADEFARCRDQNIFNRLIREHEIMVGELIGQIPVKEQYFADFKGEVKSLGAWGGDFYLISGTQAFDEVKIYFENKGFSTIFKWTELILTPLS